ncbi:MAG: metal-sensitive transcriptional regulator [Bacteriovoracaceae bacterium]|nr:metal-sensitive transcriptional regulator [Bacteriovoracaceae bacterium]
MKHADHSLHLARIKKIGGQVNGIQKMVQDGRYCVEILTQIKAAKSALKSLESVILEEHIRHCLAQAASSKDKLVIEEKIAEISDLLKKSIR